MKIKLKSVWIIASKDRTVIATGSTRNRSLMLVSDLKKQSPMLYRTIGAAKGAIKNSWFFNCTGKIVFSSPITGRELLEPVELKLVAEEAGA